MNSNNIEITQILGTDSLSSSRIVINDNFKILANALNNYQNFFDENGVYSSKIISKDVGGKIEFLPDTSSAASMMTLSQSEGVAINLPLVVGGKSTFGKVLVNELSKNTAGKITITSDVEIQGNLSVSGTTPGGSGSSETIIVQKLREFEQNSREGYEKAYNKGCCVITSGEAIRLTYILSLTTGMNTKTIAQYIHKPFVFTGPNAHIRIDNIADINRITTNGMITGSVLHPTNQGQYTTIKVYPAIASDDKILFDIQFSTTPR